MNNPADGEWILQSLFTTRNRFEALNPNPSQNDSPEIVVDDTSDTEDTNNAIHYPHQTSSPMKGILDFPNFCSALIELIGVDHFFSCRSAGDRLKIQTSNPESYRVLIRYLKESKAEYHTFQLREDKPTRVFIQHIHPSTPTDLIKTELESRLFEVRQVTNILHEATKCPLPLFFVDLEPTAHSNDIY